MDSIYLIGNGGHSKVVRDILTSHGLLISGIYDDNSTHEDVLGGIDQISREGKYICTIGDCKTQKNVVDKITIPHEQYINAIHSTAWLSPFSQIDHGCMICPFVCIQTDAKLGNHAIINTGAIVEWETSHI